MRNKQLWRVIGLLAGLSVVSSAGADELDYRGAIDAAVEAFSQQRYDEALGMFLKAHELRPSARTLRGIGMASFETRRYADSIRYLTEALQEMRTPLTPVMRSEAERVIRAAQPFVVELELDVQPVAAEVAIDGVSAPAGEQRVLLDSGSHQVTAKAPGYQTAVQSVQWPPGTHARLQLRLIREVATAAAEAPGAPAPDRASPAAPPAETRRAAGGSRFGAWKWVALGTSAAALAVTGVAIALRQDRARAIDHACNGELPMSGVRTCEGWYESGQTWQKVAIASGAVGAALTVTTVVLFATDRPRETARPRASRALQVALGGRQVSCRLQF